MRKFATKPLKRFGLSLALAAMLPLLSAAAPALTAPNAMKLVLGPTYDADSHCGEWKLSEYDLAYFSRQLGRAPDQVAANWKVCPDKLLSYVENGESKAFMVLKVTPVGEDLNCHFCGPEIGLASFIYGPKGWKLKHQSRLLATGLGHMGAGAEAKLIPIQGQRQGVVLDSGFVQNGISGGHKTLLAEIDGWLYQIWEGPVSRSNEGSVDQPRYSFDSSLRFVPVKGRPWPELHQVIKGTRGVYAGKTLKVVPLNETRIYRFDGRKYKPVKAYSDLRS